jgi:hypothetical protein
MNQKPDQLVKILPEPGDFVGHAVKVTYYN